METRLEAIFFLITILSLLIAVFLKVFSKIFKNPKINSNQKILWVLVIICMPFLGILFALLFIKNKLS